MSDCNLSDPNGLEGFQKATQNTAAQLLTHGADTTWLLLFATRMPIFKVIHFQGPKVSSVYTNTCSQHYRKLNGWIHWENCNVIGSFPVPSNFTDFGGFEVYSGDGRLSSITWCHVAQSLPHYMTSNQNTVLCIFCFFRSRMIGFMCERNCTPEYKAPAFLREEYVPHVPWKIH
jgi:hypothetical protein